MNEDTFVIDSKSPEETERLGRTIAGMLTGGGVIGLNGDLAAGKTCFVRGMASHFGVADLVHSPTFTLVNQYGSSPRLIHMDLYRLSGSSEFEDLGCAELFESPNICVIEWADRAADLLPAQRLEMLFEHVDESRRRVTLHNREALPADWRDQISIDRVG